MSKIELVPQAAKSPATDPGPKHSDASPSNWFAAYVTSRHEKTVAAHLAQREIEHFLPLYSRLSTWKNGCKVNVQQPLFPGYVFVRIDPNRRVGVLQVPGVLQLVGTTGKPSPLPDAEIEALRAALPSMKFEPHPYLIVGDRARIINGTLAGLEGVLLRKKGSLRVVLSLDLISQSVAVEVDAADLEPVHPHVKRYTS